MFKGIDLFSDTMTLPSEGMLHAMTHPPFGLGDEQREEDGTTLALQERAAELVGKTAALFLPSATMANEIAILLHCQRGDEVIAADNAHIFTAESGGPSFHAGAQSRPINSPSGVFSGEELIKHFRPFRSPQIPVSALVVIENTTNFGGGLAWPQNTLSNVLDVCQTLGLKTHLDGSRLFNAAAALKVAPAEISGRFDTVTLCLSKGLGCPAGAILAFAREDFPRIRRLKQVMGGGMRQSGILAAAGLYALENNLARLPEDHAHAALFSARLVAEIPQIRVENNPPETNMVFFAVTRASQSQQFLEKCVRQGLRFSLVGENRFRAVTHLGISRADIARAISILKEVFTSLD